MESTNLREDWQEEDIPSRDDPLCYGLSWYQNHILNDTRNHTNFRDAKQQVNHNVSLTAMSPDMGARWIENFNAQELQQLARIKHELSVPGTCLKLPDIISYSPTSSEEIMSKNNNQLIQHNNGYNQDMFFKSFSNGCHMKSDDLMNPIPSSFDTNSCYRGTFSQTFPTLKVLNTNQPSNAFDMNSAAIDPFGYSTLNGSFNHNPSPFNAHHLGDFKDNNLAYGINQRNSKMAPAYIVETTEAKRRACNVSDAKAPKANPTKKSKPELRPSSTHLKVRKEKLGDRILALQQIVAPFGKTDASSVLMEAIGYIKFLQNQVETLSVPYMNSIHHINTISTNSGGSTKDGNEETKRDLRSQGLCLVPISYLTYVTYGGGSVWETL